MFLSNNIDVPINIRYKQRITKKKMKKKTIKKRD